MGGWPPIGACGCMDWCLPATAGGPPDYNPNPYSMPFEAPLLLRERQRAEMRMRTTVRSVPAPPHGMASQRPRATALAQAGGVRRRSARQALRVCARARSGGRGLRGGGAW
eukprot:scaffold1741_cov409-Prasinococcus_capsulatus_cf.AAC.2